MGTTLGSHEAAKLGQKRPYRRFRLQKTTRSYPPRYFPNSFSKSLVNQSTVQRPLVHRCSSRPCREAPVWAVAEDV